MSNWALFFLGRRVSEMIITFFFAFREQSIHELDTKKLWIPRKPSTTFPVTARKWASCKAKYSNYIGRNLKDKWQSYFRAKERSYIYGTIWFLLLINVASQDAHLSITLQRMVGRLERSWNGGLPGKMERLMWRTVWLADLMSCGNNLCFKLVKSQKTTIGMYSV